MEMSSLASLELSDIGLHGGVDMRPTLLRVLTDLYVQKLTHTPDEECHYTVLALRLLDSVDVQTRAAVAVRLAHHLSPPRSVVEKLAADLPEVSAALRSKRPAQMRGDFAAAERNSSLAAIAHPRAAQAPRMPVPVGLTADVAGELNELFFAANANERRLILLNLHIVTSVPARCVAIVRDGTVGRKLEGAALARKHEDFASELARALRVSRQQARRIAGDELGEPIVVAAKALGLPRDLLYRILLFVNTAVGHSVERVHALATLYDELNAQAVQDLVAVWQVLNVNTDARGTATHRPLLANEKKSPHPTAAMQRAPVSAPKVSRREAS
jgi:uncharacterized protein (DUF2336 family)